MGEAGSTRASLCFAWLLCLGAGARAASVNLSVTVETSGPSGEHLWTIWPSASQCPCTWGDVAGAAVVAEPLLGCSELVDPSQYEGKVVIMDRGECNFLDKGLHAQKAGAVAVLVSDYSNATGNPPMPTDMFKVHIPFAMVKATSAQMMKDLARDSPPATLNFNVQGCPCFHFIGALASQIIVWSIGVFTTVLGSYLAGAADRVAANGLSYEEVGERSGESELQQDISLPMAVGFAVLASCMLVLLFFLHDYLAKVILVVYTAGGFGAMLHVLTTAFSNCTPGLARERVDVPFIGELTKLNLLLAPVAAGAAVSWFVWRHAPCAWLLQNFMSFSLCVQIMSLVRVNSVKTCTVMLSLMFFYDIFWVFLSGYFFKKSVMIEVATGGGSGESLPMLFAVPHNCGYSMLGLGDIVIPSMLMCLSLRLDYANDVLHACSPRGYFFVNALGYALGLALADVAVTLSGVGQPALLYLVPCTLGPVLYRAIRRQEFKWVWEDPFGEAGGAISGRGMRVDYAESVDFEGGDDWSEKVSLVQPRDVRSF